MGWSTFISFEQSVRLVHNEFLSTCIIPSKKHHLRVYQVYPQPPLACCTQLLPSIERNLMFQSTTGPCHQTGSIHVVGGTNHFRALNGGIWCHCSSYPHHSYANKACNGLEWIKLPCQHFNALRHPPLLILESRWYRTNQSGQIEKWLFYTEFRRSLGGRPRDGEKKFAWMDNKSSFRVNTISTSSRTHPCQERTNDYVTPCHVKVTNWIIVRTLPLGWLGVRVSPNVQSNACLYYLL